MLIEFLCPNGHPVHAPEEYAGRQGKCPQCGAKFQIPTPSEIEKQVPQKPDQASAEGAGKPAVKEPQIEFLCPNGHRLHGPTSLQGKPGECPECGSKFRIPSYEEDVSEEERVEQQDIGVGGVSGEASGLDLDQQESAGDDETYAIDIEQIGGGGPPPMPPQASVHPWAALMAKLWAQQTPGAVLEVLLSDGEALVPDHFSAADGGRHAVFAVKNSNGTYTLTAVAWDAITRILVRGLKKLPEEIFGE